MFLDVGVSLGQAADGGDRFPVLVATEQHRLELESLAPLGQRVGDLAGLADERVWARVERAFRKSHPGAESICHRRHLGRSAASDEAVGMTIMPTASADRPAATDAVRTRGTERSSSSIVVESFRMMSAVGRSRPATAGLRDVPLSSSMSA